MHRFVFCRTNIVCMMCVTLAQAPLRWGIAFHEHFPWETIFILDKKTWFRCTNKQLVTSFFAFGIFLIFFSAFCVPSTKFKFRKKWVDELSNLLKPVLHPHLTKYVTENLSHNFVTVYAKMDSASCLIFSRRFLLETDWSSLFVFLFFTSRIPRWNVRGVEGKIPFSSC